MKTFLFLWSALALSMLAVSIEGQTPTPAAEAQPRGCRDRSCARSRVFDDSQALAFFEFAPESGAGMGAACACTSPTGAKGEALTFTRASSATCLKGGTTSGIANGDMVTCTANQARVMPGLAGAGPLGLLVEGTRTNIALRSQEFDNAAWTKTSSVVAIPVVTADQAVAPDGTTTADRVQFPVVTGVQYSAISQTTGAGAYAGSVFVKGNGGSGSIWLDCHTGAADNCAACAYNSTTWTRCSCSGAAGTPNLLMGNYPVGCGGVGMAAADVFMWGGQIEASGAAFASSYIATAGSAVARSEDLGKFLGSWAPGAGWSLAATVTLSAVKDTDPFFVEVSVNSSANDRYDLYWNGAATLQSLVVVGGVTFSGSTLGVLVPSTSMRVGAYYEGANQFTCVAGTCTSQARVYTPITPTAITIGNFSSGGDPAWGVVKQVCYDLGPSRCR